MIALSPIFVISFTIIVLLILLFFIKINSKVCAIITVCGLGCALTCAVIIGYNISSSTQMITNISNDNMQISDNSDVSIQDAASSSEQTIAVDAVPTEVGAASNDNNVNTQADTKKENNTEVSTSINHKTNINTETHTNIETSTNSVTYTNNEESTPVGSNVNTDPTTAADNNKGSNNLQADASVPQWKASHITALFTCDNYGLLYTGLILIIAITVSSLAYRWFVQEQLPHGLFYVILLFMTLGGITLVYASHLISFFIGIELLSIPFVGLIGYQYIQTHSLEAAVKYMILSAVASAFLLMGIAFYYATTGELTFSGLSYQLSTMSYPSNLLLMGVCLILVGVGFKLSLVPFQLWLPDVYQGAPTVVALLLSTVGKVALFCAIARLFLLAPIVNNETIRMILVIMAFLSILWGNLIALMQSSLKRLLAYSSIAHFGYLLIALISVQYQVLALETIGVYLIGYILANICILGVISLESHSNELQDHENEVDLSGLFWRRPILALTMGIGLLSLAGVPLTAGFVGRFLLVLLGVTAELWWLIAAVVIGSALGLYFYARLIINLYIRPTYRDDQLINNPVIKLKWQDIKISELIIALSALLILICGIYPKWLFNLVSMAQYLTT
ncbi:NADH-quinone oxidoreductase subunit NuoN [Gilliamella sp. B2776]|uniref:NADH-quinone oxidoreductase subunit N n=1 Tax=unclassified Gilliamella TaxID=2685620 RepID=UPI002269E2E1|nr:MULTISPECIES: NADH-quinone oxidoreductase subunit NuoN [unclassified Gilliamella]MCX8648763.1 NADH-quinone oxidoreductase subunit NuoN [Gilliamella sp. B2779]MCX8653361.1 NADH-quinone oxidoreductase subunit NuoN [Gilliamella sp. B2737]MCX8655637.1 NADH-quinone oxidoreductase subunit NuoN [Gilliamella sp. B2894]MCX8690575.1 NADH-quinone oxidoreductase subunit NuoN [Gilliamella sp. B2776]MCX8694778.1 NADH-quinone oxidoreductase subunit NuoN [Gilliamella sp. B2881]